VTTIVRTVEEWRRVRSTLDGDVGFVPTMGALHEGHLSLVRRSLNENPHTVVSIFVNPTQFNDASDLEHYPRTEDEDLRMLGEAGVDYAFLPSREIIYPDEYRYRVTESEFSRVLCGAHRPGHFDGVLTVCLRLFSIVRPTRAYFGEKDYQQLRLVENMARSFFLDLEIVPCPIVREPDGLAMSSRNRRLSADGRRTAAEFARVLREGSDPATIRAELGAMNLVVDYVEEIEGRRFGAVVVEGVRLIDNVPLTPEA
jgi:pantoate--beta-alanine ligase